MPASLIRRFDPASATRAVAAGTNSSLTVNLQGPDFRATCRTLLSATNALRTA